MNMDRIVDLAAQLRDEVKAAEKYIAGAAARAEKLAEGAEALVTVEAEIAKKTALLHDLAEKHDKLASDYAAIRKQVLNERA